MKLLIETKQEDIEIWKKGIRCNVCPIKKAFSKLLKLPTEIIFVSQSGVLIMDHYKQSYFTEEVSNWINELDSGMTVNPISFEIELEPYISHS